MERAGAMSEPKPLASLNGSLLARKGGAKPAMRSQMMQPYAPLGVPMPPPVNHLEDVDHLEDLGWNDMGDPQNGNHHAEILPLTPAPINPEAEAEAKAEDELAAAQLAENAQRLANGHGLDQSPVKPHIVRQREEIAARLAEPAPERTEKPARRKARSKAANDSHRAAFTLRLDTDRHLKLRLACTVRNRSAQQIVTEALDRLLNAMPEIESLAAQVKRH